MQVQPSQVSPGENFDVFYFIRNHTDSTTYYIQTKIYDVRTGEELAIVPLSQSATNSRLFIATTQAPPDPVGYGRNIVAIATVYTDSGYTTKSENYEEQEAYYLVKALLPMFGGGAGVDYRVVRDIIQEELDKAVAALKPKDIEFPDGPDMSFVERLFGAIDALQQEVDRIPKEAANLEPLKGQLSALSGQLSSRPQFERTDLTSLAELAQNALTELKAVGSDGKVGNAQLIQAFESALQKFKIEFEASIEAKIEETIQSQEITLPLQMTVRNSKNKQKEEADPTAAVRHLMS